MQKMMGWINLAFDLFKLNSLCYYIRVVQIFRNVMISCLCRVGARSGIQNRCVGN